MARQLSTTLRNNRANQIESTIGTAPIFRVLTGTQPASCAAAETGTKIVDITLPSDWLSAASSGAVSKVGTWSAAATGAGTNTAGYYRIYDSAGTTCHDQGSITATGGGGDATIDNTSVANGQTVTVTAYTSTEGGA